MRATDRYLTEAEFAKDHWSTLAYMETVMVDCAGFQVGCDARMRQNRRNLRIMTEQCPKPKRTKAPHHNMAVVMDIKHSTTLPNGELVEGHDDWCCVQDMANAGYFNVAPDEIEPGAMLHLSDRGRDVASELRRFKADGGSFGKFRHAA